jgi:hypothetical protein
MEPRVPVNAEVVRGVRLMRTRLAGYPGTVAGRGVSEVIGAGAGLRHVSRRLTGELVPGSVACAARCVVHVWGHRPRDVRTILHTASAGQHVVAALFACWGGVRPRSGKKGTHCTAFDNARCDS